MCEGGVAPQRRGHETGSTVWTRPPVAQQILALTRALVVQRIEQKPSKLWIEVRLLSRVRVRAGMEILRGEILEDPTPE